jgi:hypothetical protein
MILGQSDSEMLPNEIVLSVDGWTGWATLTAARGRLGHYKFFAQAVS